MDTSSFRNGLVILHQGEPYRMVYFQHVKPGKGGAFVRTKLKGVLADRQIEVTFRAGEKVEPADIEYVHAQFLYSDGGFFNFMVNETFEQHSLPAEMIGANADFLRDGTDVKLTMYNGNPVGVELPNKMEFVVTEALPAVKGDTSTSLLKEVMIETGARLKVPAFINQGDRVRINTETREYDTRV